MNKRKRMKKVFSLLLSALLIFSLLSVGLLAEEETDETPAETEIAEGNASVESPETPGEDLISEEPEEPETEAPDPEPPAEEYEEPEEPREDSLSPEDLEKEELFDEDTGMNPEEDSPEDSAQEESPGMEPASVSDDPQDQIANSEEVESPVESDTEMPDVDPSEFAESEDQIPDSFQTEETQDSEEELPKAEDTPIPSESEDSQVLDEPPEIDAEPASGLDSVLAEYGYAYLRVKGETPVFSLSSCNDADHFFTITDGILLVTSLLERENGNVLRVWYVSEDQFICAYVLAEDLEETSLTDEEIESISREAPCEMVYADVGELLAFVVQGEPIEIPLDEEEPESVASVGSFVGVTIDTRAFTQMDDSADEKEGDFFDGYFIRSAPVRIESIQKDFSGRVWYEISYLMGPEESGLYYNTILATTWVLAEEIEATEKTKHEPTDYAFDEVPLLSAGPMLRAFSPTDMSGFTLKSHSGGITTFPVGQNGLYATSGHDNEYPQLAKSAEDGTMYATPHYLGGNTVYCLEHTMDSPAVRDNPAGPYSIVDIASYKSTPGYSRIIFKDRTLHAIGWIMKHSWPFQVLNRTDTYNNQWTRVAAQFAMRTLIQEIEGDEYVRDYWEMDDFYATKEGAPAVYLKYARWLAENAITRGRITGKITVSNQTITQSGSTYTGKAKLTTDADLMRIKKSAGTVKGNTAGSDDTYYYLNSGDTISITSKKVPFSVAVESASDEDEEANFVIGIPNADIQKIIIPQYGLPPAIQSTTLSFQMPEGSVTVIKIEPEDGIPLPGAVFELLSGNTIVATQSTGSDGTTTFTNLTPGTYTVREKTAPAGYALPAVNTQSVTVTGGETSNLVFMDSLITGRIRIVKTDSITGEPLAGAVFTVTRLSVPTGFDSSLIGTVVATLTTNSNGIAETGLLLWGEYRIEETGVPEGYAGSVTQTVWIQ